MPGINPLAIGLSDDEIFILGRPNYSCARIAQILIAADMYKNKERRAEYEQAVFIHWSQKLLKKHGKNWRKEASIIIEQCENRIEAKRQVAEKKSLQAEKSPAPGQANQTH